MSRIDITRLRKMAGISQKELAEKLQVRQSFLSAIENGRSRIPEEKLELIKDIFAIDDLSQYMIDDANDTSVAVPPHSHIEDGRDAITSLLEYIHAMAHQKDKNIQSRDPELEERISILTKRNDRLSDRIDDLRDEIDRLREEIFRLKDLLVRNSIDF